MTVISRLITVICYALAIALLAELVSLFAAARRQRQRKQRQAQEDVIDVEAKNVRTAGQEAATADAGPDIATPSFETGVQRSSTINAQVNQEQAKRLQRELRNRNIH